MISDGLDHLYATLHDEAIAGELIEYHIGTASLTLLAVLEKSQLIPPSLIGLQPGQFDLAQSSPLNIDHDFSILAADLQIDGVPILPAKGHQIKRTFGGSTKVYQLAPSGPGNTVWEWQDGYDKRYLMHAKFIREEP